MSEYISSVFTNFSERKVNPLKPYKERHSFEDRKKECEKVKTQFPEKFPVIVDRGDVNTPPIDHCKFLVPKDTTVSQFVYIVRKRINLKPDEAIFFFVNNTMPTMNCLISQLYKEYSSDDGFLYVTYSGESTFGFSH